MHKAVEKDIFQHMLSTGLNYKSLAVQRRVTAK